MAEVNRVFQERRRGPDAVVKAVWWIVGAGWLLIISAFMITLQAQPRTENFIDRFMKVSVRHYWDERLLQYAFYVTLINLAVCIIGFVFNMIRHKRKTDKISKSILALFIINLAGIILYLTR